MMMIFKALRQFRVVPQAELEGPGVRVTVTAAAPAFRVQSPQEHSGWHAGVSTVTVTVNETMNAAQGPPGTPSRTRDCTHRVNFKLASCPGQ